MTVRVMRGTVITVSSFENASLTFITDRLRSVFKGVDGAAVIGIYDEHGNRLTGGDDGGPSDALLDMQDEAIARLVNLLEREDLIA